MPCAERHIGRHCGVTHYRSVLTPANHDRRATCARVERRPAGVQVAGGQPSCPQGGGSPLTLSIRTSMRLAVAMHAWDQPSHLQAGVRGTRPRGRASDISGDRKKSSSLSFQPVPQSSWRRELKKRCRRWKFYFTSLRYASIPLSRRISSGLPLRSIEKMR